MQFTVGVYLKKGEEEDWTALSPVKHPAGASGGSESRLRERVIDNLRTALRRARPADQELFQLPLGTELMRVPVDVKAKGGHIHGHMPLIVEPRWTSEARQHYFAYHPTLRHMWFVTDERTELASLALAVAREHWTDLDDLDDVDEWLSDGKDRLITVAFSAEPMSLLDMLPSRKKDNRAGASSPRQDRVLHESPSTKRSA